jgi:hypothetical protein
MISSEITAIPILKLLGIYFTPYRTQRGAHFNEAIEMPDGGHGEGEKSERANRRYSCAGG